MKYTVFGQSIPLMGVAPPRGERGLKFAKIWHKEAIKMVAPPRGERGLKSTTWTQTMQTQRRSPSWGAWIEITHIRCRMALLKVAPPRGERGLKSCRIESECAARTRRSPSWGAWIEIALQISLSPTFSVAPPRGERGLKFIGLSPPAFLSQSLPLVGSVD